MSKTFPSDKINLTKYDFFLSCVPTHHSFTFNLQFLKKLKRKVCLSKNSAANNRQPVLNDSWEFALD